MSGVSNGHTNHFQEAMDLSKSELEQRRDPDEVGTPTMHCSFSHRASGCCIRGGAQERGATRGGICMASLAIHCPSTDPTQEQSLRSQVERLRAELDEAESARRSEQITQEALREVRPASHILRARTVDPPSDRRSRNFAMTSMKGLK